MVEILAGSEAMTDNLDTFDHMHELADLILGEQEDGDRPTILLEDGKVTVTKGEIDLIIGENPPVIWVEKEVHISRQTTLKHRGCQDGVWPIKEVEAWGGTDGNIPLHLEPEPTPAPPPKR